MMMVDSPLGMLCLEEEGGALTQVTLGLPAPGTAPEETPLLLRACRELQEYFAGERLYFDLPLAPKGTNFQRRVWRAIASIPFGQTRTYRQVAAFVESPRAARAVGAAAGRNPLPLFIPCHRVIGTDGALTGFALGVDKKEWLLRLERETLEKM